MSDLPLHHGSGLNPGPTRGKGFASHASASMLSQPDVFTTDEIARAAGVPRAAIQRLVDTGELTPVAGFDFFDTRAAVRAGLRARRTAALGYIGARVTAATRHQFEGRTGFLRRGVVAASRRGARCSCSGQRRERSNMAATTPKDRLVFLAGPGPGGGGGGGGRAPRAPVTRIEKPKPTGSPVLHTRTSATSLEGARFAGRPRGGRQQAAFSRARGSGPGVGPGVDDGTGGGAGGGPFRPGSGIEPPRLLREVKAQYTEEARTRGVTGDVVLEIVIKSDGSVGDVKVLRGSRLWSRRTRGRRGSQLALRAGTASGIAGGRHR